MEQKEIADVLEFCGISNYFIDYNRRFISIPVKYQRVVKDTSNEYLNLLQKLKNEGWSLCWSMFRQPLSREGKSNG